MATKKHVSRETIELSDVDCPCGQGKMAYGEIPCDDEKRKYPHEVYCQHPHEDFMLVLGVKARTRESAESMANLLFPLLADDIEALRGGSP